MPLVNNYCSNNHVPVNKNTCSNIQNGHQLNNSVEANSNAAGPGSKLPQKGSEISNELVEKVSNMLSSNKIIQQAIA